MDFQQLVQHRNSCRKYDGRAVDRTRIEAIMEACRLAPSACNSQPWRFVVVDEPDLKNRLAQTTTGPLLQFNRFCLEAPVLAALVAEPPSWLSKVGGRIKDKDYFLMDIGIVAEHFCLQAAELGLGSCMIGWFNEKKARQVLGIPPSRRIPLLITLGYPAHDKARKKIRKSPEQLYTFNSYPKGS
jgi:nitroreductase